MMGLKQKLKNKEVTVGSWLSIANPAAAEIMAKAGFEWLVIDMEHSSLSSDQCQELIRVIDLCGNVPLVRVGANDPLLIKRAMDAGAHGVVVPMVGSKADATKAVHSARYPPHGNRGVGLSRAHGYGVSFEEYKKWLQEESVVIAQIEHINGVEHLDEILSVDGIDGIIVGPYDLSGSLGKPGDFKSEQMRSVLDEIRDTSVNKNMPLGYHVVFPNVEEAQEKIKQGYNFIAFGVDFLYLGETCREKLGQLQDFKTEQPANIKEIKV